MARDPVRQLLALALSVAALAHAGCMRGAYSLREAPDYIPPAAGDGLGAEPAEPLDMSRGVHGTLGAEVGEFSLRSDGWCDEYEKATYYGARYSRMLGLNWGLSVTAGYISAPAEDVGEDDLDFYLTRCTLEFGTYIGTSLCRWYIGAGGGYTIFDEEQDLSGLSLGTIDDEWTTHAVIGVEFRNETIFATRIEGSHAWLEDSGADHWLGSLTIAVQF
ncbi:MAG: hypothetical protein ACYTKD_24525 [Planctomycetota bacterium]